MFSCHNSADLPNKSHGGVDRINLQSTHMTLKGKKNGLLSMTTAAGYMDPVVLFL